MRVASLAMSFAVVAACGGSHGGQNPDAATIDSPGNSPDGPSADSPASSPKTISVTLVNRPNTAATFAFLAAFEDGAGAWQLAPAPAGDVYTFTVNAPVWSFAWTCIGVSPSGSAPQQREVNVYSFAVAERTKLTVVIPPRCSDRAPTLTTLGGMVSNRPVGGALVPSFGSRTGAFNPGNSRYSIETPDATHDLIVGHALINGIGGGSDIVVDSAFVQRGVVVAGATMHNVDYALAAATQTFPVTVGSNAAQVDVSTVLASAGATVFELVHQVNTGSYVTNGLAAAQAAAGDLYAQSITVAEANQGAFVQDWVTTVAAQTFAAPTPLGAATVSVAATMPYPLLLTTWAPHAAAVGYDWSGHQQLAGSACGGGGGPGNACAIAWNATISAGYVGNTPEHQMPDLSALAGWDAGLQFQAGTIVSGTASATTSTAGTGDFPFVPRPAAGTTRTIVATGWSITP